jgi:hypothetical protein
MEIKSYLKRVQISQSVLKKIKETPKDRLGIIMELNLIVHPNKPISSIIVLDWFTHILALAVPMCHYEHIKDREFGEMGACFINLYDYSLIRIGHKYWSYKTAVAIIKIIRALCVKENIPITFE